MPVIERVLYDCSHKPVPIFYNLGTEDRCERKGQHYFGLEVETEIEEGSHNSSTLINAINQSRVLQSHPEWYAKRDDSLTCGVEFVSHPATLDYWLAFPWAAFQASLVAAKFCAYNMPNPGIHIHVNRSMLPPKTLTRLLLFASREATFWRNVSRRTNAQLYWAKMENRMGRALVEKGHGKKLRWAREFAYGRIRMVQLDISDRDRYQAINTNGTHTIEFRLFRGTLHANSIRRNIAFTHAACSFAADTTLKSHDLTVGSFKTFVGGVADKDNGARGAVYKDLLYWMSRLTS